MIVKYGIIQHGMWMIFQSGFRKQLSLLHITEERAKKDIMKTAHQKYREIIRMIDPFGKNDVLLVNILSASAFAGIYLSLPAEYRLTLQKDIGKSKKSRPKKARNQQIHIHGNTLSIPAKTVNILTRFSVIAAFGI